MVDFIWSPLKFVADNIALWVVAKYLILIGDWYYIQLDLCINIPGSLFFCNIDFIFIQVDVYMVQITKLLFIAIVDNS